MKIKWKYDASGKYWWTGETSAYARDAFDIYKTEFGYKLKSDHGTIGTFKKLSSAKTVANLLRHG